MDILAHCAIQATDAVGRIWIIGNSDLCRANFDAQITVNALSFHFQTHKADAVKMSVDRSERAESAAKRPAGHNEENEKSGEDSEFENVEPPHHIRFDDRHSVNRIKRIPDDPRYARTQCPPGAYPAEPVCFKEVRQKDREDEERNILAVLQSRMNSELPAFDLISLVLYPSERAEPAADGTPEDHSDGAEETDERKGDFANGTEVLKDTDRAGRDGSRTGVAVQSGEAGLLQRTVIDFFRCNNGEVAIWKDESKECYDR